MDLKGHKQSIHKSKLISLLGINSLNQWILEGKIPKLPQLELEFDSNIMESNYKPKGWKLDHWLKEKVPYNDKLISYHCLKL